MSKWTPGPWKAEAPMSANGWWVIVDSAGHELGSCDGGYEAADAALIAAAPRMAHALRLFVEAEDDYEAGQISTKERADRINDYTKAARALLERIDK